MTGFRLFLLLPVLIAGCSEVTSDPGKSRPLPPLVYTEHPELSPEAAAVRERRLMRELVEGTALRPDQVDEEAPVLTNSAQALGQVIFEALIERQEDHWDRIFVQPSDWRQLVGGTIEDAARFRDEIQGKSLPLWQRFAPPAVSEATEGGLRAIFGFHELELGTARRLDGRHIRDDEEAAQYFSSNVRIKHLISEELFDIRIPKIVVVEGGNLVLASEAVMDRSLEVFFEAGLHLRPELMRSMEYPLPLEVGNFWRYRRIEPGAEVVADDEFEAALAGATDANEVVEEVISVDRFQGYRMVRTRRSYNDPAFTRADDWWLVTPRSIFSCNASCRARIEDLSFILQYMDQQVPTLIFPLQVDTGWAVAGRRTAAPRESVFASEEVRVPAGIFRGVVEIRTHGTASSTDRRLRGQQTRVFAPGHGVIRREIETTHGVILEELVEYRTLAVH